MIWNRRKDGRRERRKSLELSSSIAKTAETTKRKERKRRNEEKKLIREKRKTNSDFHFLLVLGCAKMGYAKEQTKNELRKTVQRIELLLRQKYYPQNIGQKVITLF